MRMNRTRDPLSVPPRPVALALVWACVSSGFVLAGCVRREPPPPSAACLELPQRLVPGVRLCALDRPREHRSGHPYHPDLDRVRLGSLEENEGRPALRVESYRVYSVEHVLLTLDLASGRIRREEHRTTEPQDRSETLGDEPLHTERRRAMLDEMLTLIERIEAGGIDGPHENRPQPELEPVRRFLDAYRALRAREGR